MLIDHFATLRQPRRPWLEPDALKEAFHKLTALQHPDKAGATADFAAINAAYGVLREPALRLRHLLQLEAPEVAADTLPTPEKLTEPFMRVATLRQAIDAFIQQYERATTPLARALLASEQAVLKRDVEKELEALEAAYALSLEALEAADREWPGRRSELAAPLAALQQELAHLSKWSSQIRESLFQLGTLG
jgi:curved DNA-binding protein CbpA